MKIIDINGQVQFSNILPFVAILGPCVMESDEHALLMAEALSKICFDLDIPFVFKTSFDKANRTSIHGERGLGLEAACEVFSKIKEKLNCPIITDVHNAEQCAQVAPYVDMLQIPAFLCRQTDLLKAAAETGKAINIKKGQFLAPWDMKNVVAKVESFGNSNILVCERGVSFGYNTLVADMTSLPIMAQTGYPVVFDATHAVQRPGGQGNSSGGNRDLAPILARAALSTGIASVFMECHNNPDHAPSDGPNMIKLENVAQVLQELKAFDSVAKAYPRTL